eukprot:3043965-Rhodomonas_salina.2
MHQVHRALLNAPVRLGHSVSFCPLSWKSAAADNTLTKALSPSPAVWSLAAHRGLPLRQGAAPDRVCARTRARRRRARLRGDPGAATHGAEPERGGAEAVSAVPESAVGAGQADGVPRVAPARGPGLRRRAPL